MFEITIHRVFSAAHALRLYDGSIEPLHGHNWTVDLTVGSQHLDKIEIVMDFHELERIVDALIAQLDTSNLNDVEPFSNSRVNPTAERVAQWIGQQVAKQLPQSVHVHQVEVGEAPGCRAGYRPPLD